jgi:hypothetical protein
MNDSGELIQMSFGENWTFNGFHCDVPMRVAMIPYHEIAPAHSRAIHHIFVDVFKREFTRPINNDVMDKTKATWLILPVVICLSQRLSHACLSINSFIL